LANVLRYRLHLDDGEDVHDHAHVHDDRDCGAHGHVSEEEHEILILF